MKVEYTDVSVTEKSLVVEIPTEVVEEEIQRVTHGYARTLKLPGFRPGKIRPRSSASASCRRSCRTWPKT